jgi:hypothetical protein
METNQLNPLNVFIHTITSSSFLKVIQETPTILEFIISSHELKKGKHLRKDELEHCRNEIKILLKKYDDITIWRIMNAVFQCHFIIRNWIIFHTEYSIDRIEDDSLFPLITRQTREAMKQKTFEYWVELEKINTFLFKYEEISNYIDHTIREQQIVNPKFSFDNEPIFATVKHSINFC